MEIDFQAVVRTYQAESADDLAAMELDLVALERHPEDDEILQRIFRVAHTLKGNARSLDFPAVAEFAHQLEDLLERLREKTIPVTPDLINLLLEANDTLRQLVPAASNDPNSLTPEHKALMQRLAAAASAQADSSSGPEHRAGAGRRVEDLQPFNARTRTLRVDIDKLDRMLNLTGEIAIARGRLRQMLEELGGGAESRLLEAHRDSDRLYMDLQELVMRARMVPVGPTFQQFLRTVRDVAAMRGKLARLTIEGEDVEVDTRVLELIRDPLMHMIRNAMDHGIETADVRRKLGKDAIGTIQLRAFHSAGMIVIQLSDDGAGLNKQRIRDRALQSGLVADADRMSDSELYRLIFEAGFSTAEQVTEVSGRGVGMDVVKRNIDALRGTVGIDSREGEGTTITIRLPLTLAIIDGFSVGVGSETYVLPLESVIECVDLPVADRGSREPSGMISLRGQPLPYLRLRNLFAMDGKASSRESLVVIKHDSGHAGVVVDVLHGESQAVIKPLGQLFLNVPGISGSTVLGSGRVALILDVAALVREAIAREVENQPV